MNYTFKKEERLKSRKLIERLFVEGKRLKSSSMQMVFLQIDHNSDSLNQASFSVAKRRFKKAVDRNRIKRLIREAYRLQKNQLPIYDRDNYTKKHIFMFIYIADTILPYQVIEKNMIELLEKFTSRIKQ